MSTLQDVIVTPPEFTTPPEAVADLIRRSRLELGDEPAPFSERIYPDGVRSVFGLQKGRLRHDPPLQVTVNQILEPPLMVVEVEEFSGTLTFDRPPPAGTEIEVVGHAAPYFLDRNWLTFVETATAKHLHDRPHLDATTLPVVEHGPVCTLAAVEALWVLANSATMDVDIHAPQEMDVPRSQRYAQMRVQIDALQDRYERECAALGVGFRAPRNVKRKRTK